MSYFEGKTSFEILGKGKITIDNQEQPEIYHVESLDSIFPMSSTKYTILPIKNPSLGKHEVIKINGIVHTEKEINLIVERNEVVSKYQLIFDDPISGICTYGIDINITGRKATVFYRNQILLRREPMSINEYSLEYKFIEKTLLSKQIPISLIPIFQGYISSDQEISKRERQDFTYKYMMYHSRSSCDAIMKSFKNGTDNNPAEPLTFSGIASLINMYTYQT